MRTHGPENVKRTTRPSRKLVIGCIFLCWYLVYNVPCSKAQTAPRLIHVFVALADNAHQGIVPVPAALGNGGDATRNLYWGAAFGVRTFFRKSSDWKELSTTQNLNSYVAERAIFVHSTTGTYLVADAYRGREIKRAILDFYASSAGQPRMAMKIPTTEKGGNELPRTASLSVYVGHDGLMDFLIKETFSGESNERRDAIILACASKSYFAAGLRETGAQPVLWTTGLMAPEGYTLKAALDGWIIGESGEQIRRRAATAYAQYQKCSIASALRLFSSSW
jgi:hypothetical protein